MGSTAFRARDGNVTVTLDDTLERLVRAAAEKVLPGVLKVMEAGVSEVLDEAHDDWPVKTGRSRAGLQRSTELDLGRSAITVRARNDVPYAIYVKPAAWHGATTAWQRLVRSPMGALHKEFVEQLGPVIVEQLRKGVHP